MPLIIWGLLVMYAVWIAPGAGFGEDPIIQGLLRQELSSIEPLVVVVFNSLGLFPLLFLLLLLRHDDAKVPAWPFVLLSFGTGAFSLLLYCFLRRFGDRRSNRTPRWLLRIVSSKWSLIAVIVMTLGNLLYLVNGFSLSAYADAFQSSHLVSVMTVDFFVLVYVQVVVMKTIYGLPFHVLDLVPIIGPAIRLLIGQNKKRASRS